MTYTLDALLKNPVIVGKIIDRVEAINSKKIWWKKFLSFEKTNERIFDSLYGTKSRVRMGSIIDKNSNKPLRGRKGLGEARLEVIPLGDRMQMDNDRIDTLMDTVARINKLGLTNTLVNEFVNYVAEDVEELALAPHKRMDKILGDLLSKGSATATLGDGTINEMAIPILGEDVEAKHKDSILLYLQNLLADKYGNYLFDKMLMSQKTFNKFFSTNNSFVKSVRTQVGGGSIDTEGLLTLNVANSFFKSVGLPEVEIVRGVVEDLEGNVLSIFADNRITLLPSGEIGKMRYRKPRELRDKVPTKSYTEREGGLFISTQYTDEGRFLENGAEWVPEIRAVKSILNLDLTALA